MVVSMKVSRFFFSGLDFAGVWEVLVASAVELDLVALAGFWVFLFLLFRRPFVSRYWRAFASTIEPLFLAGFSICMVLILSPYQMTA